jgi:hypothetical protein
MGESLRIWGSCILTAVIIPSALIAVFIAFIALICAIATLVCFVGGAIVGGPAGIAACFVAVLGFLGPLVVGMGGLLVATWLAVLLVAAVACLFVTPFPAVAGVAGATNVGSQLTGGAAMDCATAQAFLAQAQRNLTAAETARDQAAAAVDRARRRALEAVAMVAAALTTLITGWWNPTIVAAAVAALAVAAALSVRRARQLADALAALAAAEAAVVSAIADLGAAEALVLTLCGQGATPSPPGAGPGLDPANSVLLGTRAVTAARRQACTLC